MIMFLLGLLITLGAVGGLDNPDSNLVGQVTLALIGLVCMYVGSEQMARKDK